MTGLLNLTMSLDPQVFIADDAIARVVDRLETNPQYFAVSANVVNNPALSWVHYGLGVYEPFWPVRWTPSPRSLRADITPCLQTAANHM